MTKENDDTTRRVSARTRNDSGLSKPPPAISVPFNTDNCIFSPNSGTLGFIKALTERMSDPEAVEGMREAQDREDEKIAREGLDW